MSKSTSQACPGESATSTPSAANASARLRVRL